MQSGSGLGKTDRIGGFLRYTQVLLIQTAQTAVCSRDHTIFQQICHRLLTQLDRLSGSDVVITQEMIATMLGVRREGVTESAGHADQARANLLCLQAEAGEFMDANREALAHGSFHGSGIQTFLAWLAAKIDERDSCALADRSQGLAVGEVEFANVVTVWCRNRESI